jgi:hypothetical protein
LAPAGLGSGTHFSCTATRALSICSKRPSGARSMQSRHVGLTGGHADQQQCVDALAMAAAGSADCGDPI